MATEQAQLDDLTGGGSPPIKSIMVSYMSSDSEEQFRRERAEQMFDIDNAIPTANTVNVVKVGCTNMFVTAVRLHSREIDDAIEAIYKHIRKNVEGRISHIDTVDVEYTDDYGETISHITLIVSIPGIKRHVRFKLLDECLELLAEHESPDVRERLNVTIR